jgi:hypothetical protein
MANPTIGATTPRIQYTATASQTVFTVPFEFLANADLAVYVNGTLKTLTTDYTLTGANTTGGGTLTFVTGRTAGDIVTILSNLAYSRDTNKYTKYGLLPAEVLEADFDAMQVQAKQLARDGQFALRAPLTDTGSPSMTLPVVATRASKALGFDASGNPTVSASSLADIDSTVQIIDTLNALPAGASSSISYQPAGTGAVTTTVQAKLRETVSVKDFGAVGDGITDDTTAFVAMVAAITDGMVVDLLGKSYVVQSDAIVITSKNRITIRGNGAKLLKPSSDGNTTYAIKLDGCSHCIVEGIEFDRANSTHADAFYKDGIYAEDCTNLIVRNCRFTDVYNGLYAIRCPYTQFVNNYCKGVLTYSAGNDTAKILANTMLTLADTTSDTYLTSSHHSICSNNVFINVRHGVYNNGASYLEVANNTCDSTHNSALYSIGEGNVFTGNLIYNSGKDGIKVISTGSKSTISGNYIKWCGIFHSDGGAYISAHGSGHSISGNYIEIPDPASTAAKYPIGIVYNNSNISIAGNTIVGPGTAATGSSDTKGIVCSPAANTSNATISGNLLNALNWGVYQLSKSAYTINTLAISGNSFNNVSIAMLIGFTGIAASQMTYFTVTGNTINGGDGVRMYNASNGLISNNLLKGTSRGIRGYENGDRIECWQNIVDGYSIGLDFAAGFTNVGTHINVGTAATLKSIVNEIVR